MGLNYKNSQLAGLKLGFIGKRKQPVSIMKQAVFQIKDYYSAS